jgi:photosystem II stability/assembly factor-like uncharacterized protein
MRGGGRQAARETFPSNYFAIGDSVILSSSEWYGVFRSTDGGTSWAPADSGLPIYLGNEHPVNALAAHNGIFFAGTDSGYVFRSVDNGANWTAIDTGLFKASSRYYSPHFPLLASGALLFAGTDSGVFRSTDRGDTWTATDSGVSHLQIEALAVSAGTLFAGTDGSGIFRSTADGASWSPVNSGLAKFNYVVNTLSVAEGVLLAGTGQSGNRSTTINVYASTDNGAHWSAIVPDFTDSLESTDVIWAMTGDGTLFAGATIKRLLDPANIFFSVNGGGTWTRTDPGLAQAHSWRYDVNAYASVADVRFVGTGTGLVRSINGGTT